MKASRVPDDRKAEVLRLRYVDGLSTRAIAKRLSMARRTVRALLGERKPRAHAAPAARGSILAPYELQIRAELAKTPELRAPAMLERLRVVGYTGGISVLRDRMRTLRPRPHVEVFSTFTTRPGERLEVDWADLGFLLPGVPRRVSAFVAVLVHSRMLYIDFALSQQMGSFLRRMERCLAFFGGRTAVDVFDNMKTVVIGRSGSEPVFHGRFVDYARAHGFAIFATRPRRPTDKPFVERGIGFARSRFFPGRRFAGFDDLRAQGTMWRDTFANAREHEETGKVPALVFEHEERPLLVPLRNPAVDTDDLETTGVGRTHRVHFDRNDYTVPWRLHGQTLLVRANDDVVRMMLGPKEVACHPRCWSVREDIADDRHEDGLRREQGKASAGALPDALSSLGEIGTKYFATLLASRRSIRLEQVRLVLLCELFGAGATASAIEEVMRTGHIGAEYVEYVMRHKRRLLPAPAPLRLGDPALDAITVREPDLGVYDEIGAARALLDPGDPSPPTTTDHEERL
jgi:transposase